MERLQGVRRRKHHGIASQHNRREKCHIHMLAHSCQNTTEQCAAATAQAATRADKQEYRVQHITRAYRESEAKREAAEAELAALKTSAVA